MICLTKHPGPKSLRAFPIDGYPFKVRVCLGATPDFPDLLRAGRKEPSDATPLASKERPAR